MKIKNPKVTLEDEARTSFKEDVRSGFLDWLFSFSVADEEGEEYRIGGSILSMNLEKLDLVDLVLSKGKGEARQLKDSIYKLGEYPGSIYEKLYHNPKGTLKIERGPNSVLVTCGPQYSVECFDDGKWHFLLDSGDGQFNADLWHIAYGYPLWYGREKPSYLTQHSITYGYNWAGDVMGEFTYQGKKHIVKGKGQRERYVAVDSSSAEIGGWEDWGFIAFDEIHSSMYEMKLGMKDFAIYDLENKAYYPEGKMEITHEDWAFVRKLDGFIPTVYKIRIEVEGGIYSVKAKVSNLETWGVTYKVPDNPVGTLVFGEVEGSFIDTNGNIRKLTNGRGVMSIRQWHAYPRILPRELYSDEEIEGNKFATL